MSRGVTPATMGRGAAVRVRLRSPITLSIVPQYRCYFLDHRLYVVDHRVVTCETDDAARAIADELLAQNVYPAIEVWEGQRQIYEAKKNPHSDLFPTSAISCAPAANARL
jgi:predicted short-subunit dehydrogenase-like oxidoreductase (DUF2520 family)